MPDAIPPQLTETMTDFAVYDGQTVVIKIGGNSIEEDPQFLNSLALQLAFLQQKNVRVILIHGGGPQIERALKQAGIKAPKRADGRRPTSAEAIVVVEAALKAMSEAIAVALETQGCSVSVAAKTSQWFVKATPFADEPEGEDNRAGVPSAVNRENLKAALAQRSILVLHCLAQGPGGRVFNTNADDYAMAVATALNARRLVLATNVPGVYDSGKQLIQRLTPSTAHTLIANGTIAGGMIPKVESALRALDAGVGGVAIIDAHQPWAILTELLTHKGQGTLIAPD